MELKNKIALVTGAARGIGRVIADHLSEEGATVVRNDLEFANGSSGLLTFCADVSDVKAVRSMIDWIQQKFGRLDVLVNNAGIDPVAPFLEVTEQVWDSIINTNLKGSYFCAQAAARVMATQAWGRIVNISSVHSYCSMPGYSAYAASKGGISAFTRQLALDLSGYNITVNAIAPGAIEVERFTASPLFDRAAIAAEIPLGRVGIPRDVSSAVAFLASDDASWLTGQVITIDGGTTSRLFLYAGRAIPSVNVQQEPR
jgi:glucose 1-dehydrogenase/3-oxoacyl-[acyl-carrier protein] reductase